MQNWLCHLTKHVKIYIYLDILYLRNQNIYKKEKNIFVKIQIIVICNLANFRSNLSSVAILNYIQIVENFEIYANNRILFIIYISKTIQVIILKPA